MNKKIILIMIVILTISLLGIIGYKILNNYSYVLKINWNIELPKNLKEIYEISTDANFHGDGTRYHIFTYQEDEQVQDMFKWTLNEQETLYYKSYQEFVDDSLNKLNVPSTNYPNYANSQYWYNKKDDNSEIIILWDSLENKLYIIESFL